MEKRYEILEHMADGKFRAYGRSLGECLENAALALASLMWDPERIKPEIRETIRLEATGPEQLTVKFLTELIYLLEVKSFLLGRVNEIRVEEISQNGKKTYRLEAEVAGDRISPQYEIYGQVKAVTYNEMKIEKSGDGLVLQVVVDM
ncbi:MAG: Archease [Candidatus Saccharicenans subterraneus]|uniref:Archease n=1 Tax=Candidatus Saccharicenans subterraneus TaxID=2508984 RepID=A0A3E2BL75_9BACT|nr:MAG: Archease [Candidatus Saccharicenans subterraneum]